MRSGDPRRRQDDPGAWAAAAGTALPPAGGLAGGGLANRWSAHCTHLHASSARLPQKTTTTQSVENNYLSWEEQLSL